MKSHIALVFLTATSLSPAQNPQDNPEFDPVAEAVREFNSRRPKEGNDVTVVLKPAAADEEPEADPPEDVATDEDSASKDKPEKPDEPADEVAEAEIETGPAREEKKPGISVQVEKIQSGTGAIDPTKVKLLAPFPAKPLLAPPSGWRIESSTDAPSITREVELSPGATITLNIRPHLLIPEADGVSVFSIPEPGYDSTKGYQQSATMGSILAESIIQMDTDSENLSLAVGRLEQLLSSLPHPDSGNSSPDAQ